MKNFNNHYRDNLLREEKLKSLENNLNEEFSKAFAFNKIISHINEQKNIDSNKFEVTVLEAMYKDLLEYDNIPYTCHVSRFTERLMFSIPELEKIIICKRTLYVSLLKLTRSLMRKLDRIHSYNLNDGFNPKYKGFSQPALTVSQLIMHEYRKKINRNPSTIRRRHT